MARTARQRAALRKAQLASARKRRGKGKGKLAAANRNNKRTRRNARIAVGVIGAAYVATAVGVSPRGRQNARVLGTHTKNLAKVGYYTGKVKANRAQNKYLQAQVNRQVTRKFKQQLRAM